MHDGRVVEILGLRRWTLQMVQDSLARYAPDDSLQTHSCAAALRYRLGFADAASTTYSGLPNEPERIVVTVRERGDSARVHYRTLPMDTTPGRPEWRLATRIIRSQPRVFWTVSQAIANGRSTVPNGFRSAADSAAADSLLAFFRSRTTPRDRVAASDALRRSPMMLDRMVAAIIIGNFPERDDTWHALVATIMESDGSAKGVAATTLYGLARRASREIDWTPSVGHIHAALDGTSLFELPTLVDVLSRSGVGPAQARPFLRGGGEMLVTYLESGTSMVSQPAHKLLVQLRGADLGVAPGPWRTWIATL